MTWPTDEQVEKAAEAAFNAEIEMWDAGTVAIDWSVAGDDDKFPYRLAARAALSAVNPYEWREIDDTARDGSWWWGYWPTEEECDRQCPMRWVEDEQRFVDNADHREFHQPTKYMPLPPSPEGDK